MMRKFILCVCALPGFAWSLSYLWLELEKCLSSGFFRGAPTDDGVDPGRITYLHAYPELSTSVTLACICLAISAWIIFAPWGVKVDHDKRN